MTEKTQLVAQDFLIDLLKSKSLNLKNGKGFILFVSGEAGFGKTYLLQELDEYYKKNMPAVKSVFTETQAPIGNFKIGNIQPLYPFSKAIELLRTYSTLTPEKRFARNIGLTALASIPVIDIVFYAVKEMSKDWREFQKDKSSATTRKVSSAAADFYDALRAISDKSPLVILMDDMHWCDSQSVELLRLFLENIAEVPIIFVIAYKASIIEAQGLPFYSLIVNYSKSEYIQKIELQNFNLDNVSEMCSLYFANYKRNFEFEEWLLDHSYGVPGVLAEYLRYFALYPPFGPDGELVMNFKDNEFLPTTVQSVFAQHLEVLNDDDKNTLAVCSAEGREFSALVVSKLLNLDVLTAIKKLRILQTKTGFIKSIGAQTRYGVKTTIYKFTQAFYHSFFENTLEFEEYTALHGQIASLLKQKFDDTESEELKQEIAPYLAAHSLESGDKETAQNMMIISAQQAHRYGSTEQINAAMSNFESIGQSSNQVERNTKQFDDLKYDLDYTVADNISIEVNGNSNNTDESISIISPGIDESFIDFTMLRKSIISDIINNNHQVAISKADKFLGEKSNELTFNEQVQIMSLCAKAYIDLGKYDEAENILNEAQKKIGNNTDASAECLLYNTFSLLNHHINNQTKAYFYLDKAANISMNIQSELKLLTLSIISIVTQNASPEKSRKYKEAAIKLSAEMNFEQFTEDLMLTV
jgi:predicted ATPase